MLRGGSKWCEAKKCDTGNDKHAESVVKRAQEESVPHERRKDYAGYYYQDDTDTSVDVVRECAEALKKRK